MCYQRLCAAAHRCPALLTALYRRVLVGLALHLLTLPAVLVSEALGERAAL
jgi:hypothetical protein